MLHWMLLIASVVTAPAYADYEEELMTPSQIEQAQEMARNCLDSGYVDC